VDAVTSALTEEETSLARRNDQVGSNLNIAGTIRQALAASDEATGATATGSRTGGQEIQGYDAFTGYEKDTGKVTAR